MRQHFGCFQQVVGIARPLASVLLQQASVDHELKMTVVCELFRILLATGPFHVDDDLFARPKRQHQIGVAHERSATKSAFQRALDLDFLGTGLADVLAQLDRKSVVTGKSVSVSVDLGGRRSIKKKKNKET